MTARYKVLGVNDDHDTCNCCGKTGLKRVVWLAELDADGNRVGDPTAVGCNCAARMLRLTHTRLWNLALEADRRQAAEEANQVHLVGDERSVVDWIIESVGQNGASVQRLCLANGLKPMVEQWAAERFPHNEILVRRPR
jgi:hypothetical protein